MITFLLFPPGAAPVFVADCAAIRVGVFVGDCTAVRGGVFGFDDAAIVVGMFVAGDVIDAVAVTGGQGTKRSSSTNVVDDPIFCVVEPSVSKKTASPANTT
jgi:hypothetical protein